MGLFSNFFRKLRRIRFGELFKSFLLLNPLTRTIMLAKFTEERIKNRRSQKKKHPAAEIFIDTFVNNLAKRIANHHKIPIDKVKELAQQENITLLQAVLKIIHGGAPASFNNLVEHVASTVHSVGSGSNHVSVHSNADGATTDTDDIELEIIEAKKNIGNLPIEAQKDALEEITDIQAAAKANLDTANKAIKSADKIDLAQAQSAAKNTDIAKVAATAPDTTAKPLPLKTVDEKKALGESTTPAWVKPTVIGAGILIVAYAGYKIFYKKIK